MNTSPQLNIFLLSLFLIKLPPFYILPLQSAFFTTHALAKIIIFFEFAYLLFTAPTKKMSDAFKNKTFLYVLIYFLSQSLSVINAKEIVLFIKYYQNTITALMLFVVSFYFIYRDYRLKEKIFRFILTTGIVCILFEIFYFLLHKQISYFFNLFLQNEVLVTYQFNIDRGRYYLYILYELFMPFFLYASYAYRNTKKSYLYIVAAALLMGLSFFSNFRRPVMLNIFSGIAFSYFILKEKAGKWKFMVKYSVIFIAVAVFAVFLSNRLFSFNVVDRFLLSDESEDVGTIDFRYNSLRNAVDMYKAKPLLGVGLGNYEVYVNKPRFIYSSRVDKQYIDYYVTTNLNPHSLISRTLSESGIFGLISLIAILGFFAVTDFVYVKKVSLGLLHPFIISFWTIFLFSLFSPFETVFMNGWFWFIRGVIEGTYAAGRKNNDATSS